MKQSYLVDSRVDKRLGNLKPSGYLTFQFDLPFQLPLREGINLGSLSNKQMIIVKEKEFKFSNDIKKYYSRVEVVNFLIKPQKLELDDRVLSRYFDLSIDFVNQVVDSILNFHMYKDIRNISRVNLSRNISCFYIKSSNINKNKNKYINFINPIFEESSISITKLSNQELQKVATYLEYKENELFLDAIRHNNQANYNLYQGFYNDAIIKLQTFFEIFLYKIGKLVMEHMGIESIKINKIIENGRFTNLLDHQLKPFFEENGLNFDRKNESSSLYEYWNQIYLIRNRVIHEGVIISELEAKEAFKVADRFLKEMVNTIINSNFDKEKYDFTDFILV